MDAKWFEDERGIREDTLNKLSLQSAVSLLKGATFSEEWYDSREIDKALEIVVHYAELRLYGS